MEALLSLGKENAGGGFGGMELTSKGAGAGAGAGGYVKIPSAFSSPAGPSPSARKALQDTTNGDGSVSGHDAAALRPHHQPPHGREAWGGSRFGGGHAVGRQRRGLPRPEHQDY